MSSSPSFFAELQRRHVYKVGTAYCVAGWLLVQIATQVFPFFEISNAAVRWVVIAVVAGLPVALVLAWLFDITPQGIVRTADLPSGREASAVVERRRTMDRKLNYLLGLLLVAALSVVAYDHAHAHISDGEAGKPSIAVLPLVDLSGDDKDSYLGDGISGELLTALSKLPGLKVIGRTSSFQFRGRDIDAAKVGQVLHVASLLAGTVQRAGDQLRVTVELVDTASGQQLWSQHYDRSFKNLFALEDDISGAVSKALAVQLGGTGGQPLVAVATDNPHAHDLVLRAKLLIERSDESSLNQAAVLLNQAIAEDPNYAEAWATLGRTYISLADAYRAPNDLLPEMKAAAEKAVALDPTLAEAHAVRGEVLLNYVRDYPAARIELERAVELDPGSPSAHDSLATYRFEIQHDAAAARVLEQAAEKLDPLDPWYTYWEMTNAMVLGDFAGAETLARRTLQLDPKFFYRSDPLVMVYAAEGHWQPCADRAAAEGQAPADFAAAICYEHVGKTEQARAILQKLEADAKSGYTDYSNIAAVHVALGDRDGAFAALDQAYRDHSAPLMSVWSLPWFVPLHGDPRYQALLDRISASAAPSGAP